MTRSDDTNSTVLRTHRLSDHLQHAQNNFDLLRLCAALLVMFGHSFWIQPASGRTEPILRFTGLEYSGSLSVYTFFLLSGLLVSASFDRQESVWRFAALRLVRIYPALIACTFLTAYAIFPICSTLDFASAVRSRDAWTYFAKNTWLFSGVQWTLPSIFENNALKSVVNGSLWTLPNEIKCYALVLMAGISGCYRSKYRFAFFFALASALFALVGVKGSSIDSIRLMFDRPNGYSFYAPPFFLLGMLIYVLREHIKINWMIAAALCIAYFLARHSSIAAPLFYVAFVYTILLIGVTNTLKRLAFRNDYSYGIYLWAFPIQQIVASKLPEIDNLVSLAISMPITLLTAVASWHLVESPAVQLVRSYAARIPNIKNRVSKDASRQSY